MILEASTVKKVYRNLVIAICQLLDTRGELFAVGRNAGAAQ